MSSPKMGNGARPTTARRHSETAIKSLPKSYAQSTARALCDSPTGDLR